VGIQQSGAIEHTAFISSISVVTKGKEQGTMTISDG
jgi:hypothetical protein